MRSHGTSEEFMIYLKGVQRRRPSRRSLYITSTCTTCFSDVFVHALPNIQPAIQAIVRHSPRFPSFGSLSTLAWLRRNAPVLTCTSRIHSETDDEICESCYSGNLAVPDTRTAKCQRRGAEAPRNSLCTLFVCSDRIPVVSHHI